MAEATSTTVRRALEALKIAVDRLNDYTRKEDNDEKRAYYESWVNNAKEMAALLPQLNLTNDPAITAIAEEIKQAMPESALFYKDNISQRKDAARKVNDIAAKLSSLFSE